MRHLSLVFFFLKNEFVFRHAPASRLHKIESSVKARITEYVRKITTYNVFSFEWPRKASKKISNQIKNILVKMNGSHSGI